jgi:hypothetical protein
VQENEALKKQVQKQSDSIVQLEKRLREAETALVRRSGGYFVFT